MKPAVVIPAFNESATIREVVEGCLKYCDTVIVVDDGSTDGTSERLTETTASVLRNERNAGKAASLHNGFAHALSIGHGPVISMDGDLQHRPEEIPRLLEQAARFPNQLIIAARMLNRDQAPPVRRFANAFADFWVSWAAGHPVRDSQSGYRVYPSSLLAQTSVNHSLANSFVFESEILIEAAKYGIYSHSVPVDTIYREGARASHYRPWRDTSRIVIMIAGKLIRRGLYPTGLLRALGVIRVPANQAMQIENSHADQRTSAPTPRDRQS